MKYLYLTLSLLIFIFSSHADELRIDSYKSYKLDNTKNEVPLGSGLSFFKSNAYGITRYYTVADKINSDSKNPKEIPLIAILKEKRGKLSIERYLSINNKNFPEVKLNELDLEAVSSAPNDSLWVADEKTLNLLNISTANGNIEEIIKLSKVAHELFKHRKEGRGFEGLTLLPNKKLLVTLQSSLKNNYSKIMDKSFIPFYLYDLKSKKEQIIAYPVDGNEEQKIGGLQAIDKNRFLLVERFEDKNELKIKILSLENLVKLTDDFLGNTVFKFDEAREEFDVDVNKLNSIKIEGIALLEGGRDIVLINDGDGGDVQLTTITLNNALISWGFKEYFIFSLLFLILLASLVFTYRVLKK